MNKIIDAITRIVQVMLFGSIAITAIAAIVNLISNAL